MGCQMSRKKRNVEWYRFSKQNIHKFYRFGRVIGSGNFGTVREAQMIGSRQELMLKKYAIKSINKNKVIRQLHLLQRELEILHKLDHPNIIRFFETYEDQMFIYFVMEYCDGGELLEKLTKEGPMSEQKAAIYMSKLFSAISYIHSQGICHRDLKLENIMFSQGEIKIIDFGLSRQLLGNELDSQVGTPLYAAPEVLQGKYTLTCDYWSLGCIMYAMLSGAPPFIGDNTQILFNMIRFQQPQFPENQWANISISAQRLILNLLDKDPKMRITASNALKSEWITTHIKRRQSLDTLEKIGSQTIVGQLYKYANSSIFKKEALRIFLSQLQEDEIIRLTRRFEEMDIHKTGTITVDELQQVLGEMGFTETYQDLQNLVLKINQSTINNQQGTHEIVIKYSEFMAATLDRKIYLNKEQLWSLFKFFDTKDHNYIEVKDLQLTLEREGRVIEGYKIQDIFKEISGIPNGKIDFSDFCRLMHQDMDDNEFTEYFKQNYDSPTKPTLKHRKKSENKN